jgi:hypothetical protein
MFTKMETGGSPQIYKDRYFKWAKF